MTAIPSGVPISDVDPVKVNDTTKTQDGDRETDVVYIELDALLDTRIGILHQHHPELAVSVLRSGKYPKRLIDRFGSISAKEFDALYATRDIETLKHSILTNVPFFLQRLIKDCVVHASLTKVDQHLHYVVNTYPYNFDNDELKDTLISCLSFHMLDAVEISVVHLSPQELTPTYIKSNFDIMLMYRFQDWLYMHREEFKLVRCPGVTVVAPAIFWHEMPDPETIQECRNIGRDPIQIAEEQTAEFIRLKFMDVSLFCINEQINAETAADISLELQVQPEDIERAAAMIGAKVVAEEPLAPLSSYAAEAAKEEDDIL